MWVFDATPLIYLAKVDRLTLVEQLEPRCVIPERVYEEVVETGLDEGYPDARRIERSLEEHRFEIVSVETTPLLSRLQQNDALSGADAAVLACADAHDGVAVMDETYGRDVAAVEGITTRGTAYLVLKLAKRGAISVADARAVIDAMIDEGWYCAPDVYTKIVRKLDSFSE
jgi:predicted nucleic acid-binding protein